MKINTDKDCNIIIYDDTVYPINGIDYLNSVSLWVVQLNMLQEGEKKYRTLYYKVFDHSDNAGDPKDKVANKIRITKDEMKDVIPNFDNIEINLKKDGYITALHLVLPKFILPTDYENHLKRYEYITKGQINRMMRNPDAPIDDRSHIPPVKDPDGYVWRQNFIRKIEDIVNGKDVYYEREYDKEKTFFYDLGLLVKNMDYIKKSQIDDIMSGDSQKVKHVVFEHFFFSDGKKIYEAENTSISSLDYNTTDITETDSLAKLFLAVEKDNKLPHYCDYQNFVSLCYLRKCYISLCQKIFNSKIFDRCFNNKVDSNLLYKRDLVWAALNTIQYMIDIGQLAEAIRLLERISGCNGLCASEKVGNDCGCSG